MTRPAELVHVGANPELCFQQERSRCGKRKYRLLGELVQTPHPNRTPSPHGTLSRCSLLGSSKALTALFTVFVFTSLLLPTDWSPTWAGASATRLGAWHAGAAQL